MGRTHISNMDESSFFCAQRTPASHKKYIATDLETNSHKYLKVNREIIV